MRELVKDPVTLASHAQTPYLQSLTHGFKSFLGRANLSDRLPLPHYLLIPLEP